MCEKRQAVLGHGAGGLEGEDLEVALQEMSHRINNMLTVIQAIARQTLGSAPDPENFARTFQRRLSGYLSNFNLLNQAERHEATIDKVIEHQLLSLTDMDEGRVRTEGVCVLLSESQATALGMVVHELGINAIKYGALSNDRGYIEIRWEVVDHAPRFVWCEHDGPQFVPPGGAGGFGSRLIDMSVRDVARHYEPAGLRVSFTLHPVSGSRNR